MASKTIKGITVEIDGKTTKLASALKEAESPARSLETNLKNVNKALKLDPTNTELLSEKQKILASYIDVTREKLETLESVQDQIRQQYANGDIDQGAYVEFQKELEYTKSKLKDLEDQQKSFGSVVGQVMQEAGSKVSAFGDKISAAGQKMLPATAAITAAGTAAASAGSDMLESQNKVEVAFGDSADMVKKFADTTLDAYGIAEGSALDMAALFGDMATSMELPQEAAAEMSTSLVGLAGDLASFKNMELEDVSNALKGIFTGETESLKNLGVVMTQDNLLRFAMQQGMIDTTKSAQQLAKEELALEKAQVAYNEAVKKHGENSLEAREAALKMSDAEAALNESAKASLDTLSTAEMVQLRYAYVLNATTNAQGDFSRTSDSAANSMRVASEAVKELGADFGVLLAPYVAQVAQMISEMIKYLISLPEETKKTILVVAALVAGLGPLLIIGGKLLNRIGSILEFVGKLPERITAVKGAFSAFTSSLSGAFSSLAGVLSGALTSAISAVGSAISWLSTHPMVLVIGLVIAAIAALVAAIIWLWNNCEGFREFWIGLGEALKGTWNDVCASIQTGISDLVTIFTVGFPEAISAMGDLILNGLFALGEGMYSIIYPALSNIVTAGINFCSDFSEIWSGFWNSVLSWGQGQLANLRTICTTGFSSIANDFSAFCQEILGGITNWGSNIKAKASSAIDNVKNAISSGLERIKSLFNFEWSLPHIKMPHFYISGSFSLNPPSVPNFGVQWYAQGGILNGAQIFGTMGNTLLGGGEAGPEAVLPLSGFYSELRSILSSFMGSSGDSLDLTGLYNRLDGIYDRLGRLQVVLDTGVLVGETVDQYDEALAAKQLLTERGV